MRMLHSQRSNWSLLGKQNPSVKSHRVTYGNHSMCLLRLQLLVDVPVTDDHSGSNRGWCIGLFHSFEYTKQLITIQ